MQLVSLRLINPHHARHVLHDYPSGIPPQAGMLLLLLLRGKCIPKFYSGFAGELFPFGAVGMGLSSERGVSSSLEHSTGFVIPLD